SAAGVCGQGSQALTQWDACKRAAKWLNQGSTGLRVDLGQDLWDPGPARPLIRGQLRGVRASVRGFSAAAVQHTHLSCNRGKQTDTHTNTPTHLKRDRPTYGHLL